MNNWKEAEGKLEAQFDFKDFSQAWAFMNEVALAAEKLGHHPDWSNVYNRVNIQLTTHDAGNVITEKDRNLSVKIDAIFSRYKV